MNDVNIVDNNDIAPDTELPLGQLLTNAQQWVHLSLQHLMAKRGHGSLTPAHLTFLSNLDCGVTHASEVARRTGVSRQAVYRMTNELKALDVLALEDDPDRKNQKVIRMTPHGISVIGDARQCLQEVEEELESRLGKTDFDQLLAILRKEWDAPLNEG